MDAEHDSLAKSHTIAVVGLSPDPDRPSHYVSKYLQEHGYRIIPVNPMISEVLGEKSYPDLKSIPEPVDMVDIFRRPESVMPVVEEAIEIGAKYVWMQEGIVNPRAKARAEASRDGLPYPVERRAFSGR